MKLMQVEPQVLTLLDAMTFDPSATVSYEYLSGGLVWSDELPLEEAARRVVTRSNGFKFVLAYRAALTSGKERPEFRQHWEQVEAQAPNWPGLRPERRAEDARNRLLASEAAMKRALEKLR